MSEHESFKGFIQGSKYSELMISIPKFYLDDGFNYYGLPNLFSKNYNKLYKMLNNPEYFRSKCEVEELMTEAIVLYGYVHARFLSSEDGIDSVVDYYKSKNLPMCPRKLCKTKCLPYGISDAMGKYPVMFYCPNCHDVYDLKIERYKDFDGGWFGPTYVHLFENRMKFKSSVNKFKFSDNDVSEDYYYESNDDYYYYSDDYDSYSSENEDVENLFESVDF